MKKLLHKIFSKKFRFYILLICLVLIVATPFVFARAGGGGGGGGSDSGSGEILAIVVELLIRLIIVLAQLPFPANVISISILISVVIGIYLLYRRWSKQKSVLNKLPTGEPVKSTPGYSTFLKNNPSFDEEEFKEKVKTAFIGIQKAWEEQDLSNVRRFISDGVYQRFNTQFKLMQNLEQTNVIENLLVKHIYIDRIESDGLYDIIHTAIHASIKDKFLSSKYPSLNQIFNEEFVEYWSFIKKRGVTPTNMYHSTNCPKCGAELPQDMGEVSKCEFCGTITNLGEYDWVLSEITQADDYATANPKISKNSSFHAKIQKLLSENKDFSMQLIEDKASNGFLQILTAITLKNSNIMRRFVSDKAFDKISKSFLKENVTYNRLYLNYVKLIGIRQTSDKNILQIAVKYTYQTVSLENNMATLLEAAPITSKRYIIMSRDRVTQTSKGSLYSHTCPNCGGHLHDTNDIKCPFCDSILNSSKNEWIIEDVMSRHEYTLYLNEKSETKQETISSYSKKPDLIDKLYKVRDFAFNNTLIMIAADGIFDFREKAYAEKLAKRWGYNINKISGMFDMAKSGRLSLRMPESIKDRRRVYKLMKKVAMIDNNLAKEEEALLKTVEQNFLQE